MPYVLLLRTRIIRTAKKLKSDYKQEDGDKYKLVIFKQHYVMPQWLIQMIPSAYKHIKTTKYLDIMEKRDLKGGLLCNKLTGHC